MYMNHLWLLDGFQFRSRKFNIVFNLLCNSLTANALFVSFSLFQLDNFSFCRHCVYKSAFTDYTFYNTVCKKSNVM